MGDAGKISVIESYPCTMCGCTCDDIRLTVENDRVVAADNACALGVAGLTSAVEQPPNEAWIEGMPGSISAAIDRAAEILRSARSPFVYAGADSTVESQRLATQIAERIHGVFDSPAFGSAPIFPDIGTVACSLGEAKNRADLIVLWNCDPSSTHPRLLPHFLLDPPGYFRKSGRSDRTLIVVGDPRIANSVPADDVIVPSDGSDFENLWQLRAIIRRHSAGDDPMQRLADRMRAARFGVLIVDESMGARAIEAAHGLAMDLQSTRRFYVLVLTDSGNVAGLRNVASWLTGVPGPVSFRRHGQIGWGDEFCVNRLLNRRAMDAALLIGAHPYRGLTGESVQQCDQIPQIIVSSQAASFAQRATIAIPVAPFPVSSSGAVFRMDGVGLPLPRAIPTSVPEAFAVLSQLIARLPPV